METAEITELMRDRELAYRFLARAFRTAPDDAFIAALRAAADERPEDDPLADFFAEFADLDDEQARIDLAADYNRLFLGMGPQPVPPYESVYTSEEGLLMQDARDEVVRAYQAAGLEVGKDFGLPEDHLALELEFMASLAQRAAAAFEAGEAEQAWQLVADSRAFLTDHLAVWVPAFSADVAARARTTFYEGLAALAREQVAADAEVLVEVSAA